MGESSVDGSATDFHGSNGVQDLDGTLERLEVRVLVREHAKSTLVDTKADPRVNILFCRLEPGIARGLWEQSCGYERLSWGVERRTCLKM
jgi:hypothetical protein